MPADGIDIVLFDLGGVLVDFGGVGAMRELAGIDNDAHERQAPLRRRHGHIKRKETEENDRSGFEDLDRTASEAARAARAAAMAAAAQRLTSTSVTRVSSAKAMKGAKPRMICIVQLNRRGN